MSSAHKRAHKSCYSSSGISEDCIVGDLRRTRVYLDSSKDGAYYDHDSLNCVNLHDDMSDDTQHYCQCKRLHFSMPRNDRFPIQLRLLFWILFIASTSFMVATFREVPVEGACLCLPLLPSIFSVLQNRMFCILLPAWICDSIGAGNILLMMSNLHFSWH